MKTEEFLDVMNDLPDELILDAGRIRDKPVPRRRRVLRTALLAAALVLLLSATAYAAGGLAGFHTSNRPGAVWTSPDALPRAEKQLGAPIIVPESFENGFAFQQVTLRYTNRTDDAGAVVETFPELDVRYKRDGMTVMLNLNRSFPQPHGQGWTERESGGTGVWCRSETYKAVPEDYELTEEDLALRASGEMTISWGSDRVEILPMSTVQFTREGVDYMLMSMEGLPVDELFAMAEEIIQSEKT